MKEYKTYYNKIDLDFWDTYETRPDLVRAKKMEEPFKLDRCEYGAGDYLGLAGMVYAADGSTQCHLFAMPKNMFENEYRLKPQIRE